VSTTADLPIDVITDFCADFHIDIQNGVVVAFSGGADSLALLILLSQVCPPGKLTAVYVNHRLRSERELKAEEQLNADNCRRLGIPLRIARLEEGSVAACSRKRQNGIEEAARVLRYAVLERYRKQLGYAYIATAHTSDDLSETVLMRLLQGSGMQGLQGISAYHGHIIRPLLTISRQDIEQVVKQQQLRWSEDSTNADTQYLRNRIRHTVVPAIARVFPGYREALAQTAQRAQQYVHALQPLVDRASLEGVSRQGSRFLFSCERLKQESHAVLEAVVYRVWEKLCEEEGKRLPYTAVQQIIRAITADGAVGDLYASVLAREGSLISWEKRQEALAEGYVSCVYSACTELDGEHLLIVEEEVSAPIPVSQRARIASDTLRRPLIARSYRGGDRIVLTEGTKRIAALYAEWQIGRKQWSQIPVLEDTEGIVAVLGGSFGGRDRIAKRCLLPTLARNSATLYSVTDREGYYGG
jgi:tRNA(Ile)-lysidine synthase